MGHKNNYLCKMKHRQTKTTHYHYTAHHLDSVSYDDALSNKIEFHLKES